MASMQYVLSHAHRVNIICYAMLQKILILFPCYRFFFSPQFPPTHKTALVASTVLCSHEHTATLLQGFPTAVLPSAIDQATSAS